MSLYIEYIYCLVLLGGGWPAMHPHTVDACVVWVAVVGEEVEKDVTVRLALLCVCVCVCWRTKGVLKFY